MKKILFIGHDASHTGAPLVLLYLLRWLKENDSDIEADVLLLRGGVLEEEYRKVANVFLLTQNRVSIFQRGSRYLKRGLGGEKKPPKPNLSLFFRKYEVVLGNTIVTLEHLEFFKRKKIPTICWVHELEYIVRSFYSSNQFVKVLKNADEFIVGSKAVGRFLRENEIEGNVHLVYEFLDVLDTTEVCSTNNIRSEFGIPPNAFVVLGCGTIQWRKGVDLFMQIAAQLIPKFDDMYFVWVGDKAAERDTDYDRIQYDMKRMDLNGRVVITGHLEDPRALFAEMDIFALTSREDPFPLVCLMAASFGKPIICFQNAGGISEFVENDAGATIPYGNIGAFCEKIAYYNNDRTAMEKAGKAAMAKIAARFSPEISCRKIDEILHSACRTRVK